jgi:hypothetical protein
MSEIFMPLQPRAHEDPAAAGVVQANLEYVMALFEKGLNDGDTLVWDTITGRYLAKKAGGIDSMLGLPTTDIYPGREIVITDSLTVPTYFWHLRYNNLAIGSYKWEFMGGVPAHEQNPAACDTTSTAYTLAPSGGGGPQITLPSGIGGDFIVESGCVASHDSAQQVAYMSYKVGAATIDEEDACRAAGNGVGGLGVYNVMCRRRKVGVAAGAVIQCAYRSSTSGNQARFSSRWISVWPYRVG